MSLFKILKDAANDAFALSKVVLGQALDINVNGILAYVFKDKDGNAALPIVNGEGAVLVTSDAGTTSRDSQTLALGAQTKDVEAEVLALSLTAGKIYNKVSAKVDCFRASLFRLVYVDDYGVAGTEQELGYALVDAGNISQLISLAIDEFSTVGGTGVQKLVVYHTPLDKASDAYASASVNEMIA